MALVNEKITLNICRSHKYVPERYLPLFFISILYTVAAMHLINKTKKRCKAYNKQFIGSSLHLIEFK